MKVIFRQAAEDDLDRIFSWIVKDSPSAAADMLSRIRGRINLLELDCLAHMGRPGVVEDTRELLELPYIIVYKVYEARNEIVIVSIVHGAQGREK